MIVFECPSCKTKLQVADQHAGLTIQCPTCQTRATAPKAVGAAPEAIEVVSAPSAPPAPDDPTAVTTPELAKAERRRSETDDDDDRRRPRRRDAAEPKKSSGMGAGAIVGIVLGVSCCALIGVGGILAALLIPAVQKVREAAARTQSMNNLKQIGLSSLSYHDVNMRLPFNGSDQNPPGGFPVYSKAAKPNDPLSGSWAFQILPYLDQQLMFNAVDRNSMVRAYQCPGRNRPPIEQGGGAWSDYFYNNYLNMADAAPDRPDLPDNPDYKMTLVGIHDGSSNTIFAGHGNINTTQYQQGANVTLCTNIFNGGTTGTMRSGGVGRTAPPGVSLRRDSTTNPGVGSWGGPFPQGALVVFCDGTLRTVNYNTLNFNVFLTPRGNEPAMLPDF